MLSSIRIRNFRVFDAIDIERLARVNLVVGKNNAGKTCLLEALRLYGDSASEECIRRLLRGRGEDRPGQLEETEAEVDGRPRADPISRLFHGYRLPVDGTAIEIGPREEGPAGKVAYSLRLSLAAFVSETNGDETVERRIELDAADEDADIRFLVERKEPGSSWTTLRRRKLDGRFRFLVRDEETAGTRFVGTNALDDIQTLEHWRRVAVRPSARAVIEDALRLIDPEIQEIVVLPSSNPRREMMGEVILIYDETKRLSLRSLGDGIQRLFQIMVAMVASPGGLVLIDEFENGLHWSVQGQAWELLFRLSEELGVQVVATSHSWDCVASFRDTLSARDGDDGVLVNIGRSVRKSNRGAFVATHYDRRTLEQVTRAGLEVR
jgi:ABC-type lipoprotein export system ATPase subunit